MQSFSFAGRFAVAHRGLRASLALLATLIGACSHALPTAPESAGALGKFDKVWTDYDQHYSYFEYNAIDWNAIGAKYRGRVSDAMPDHDLAATIGAMIGELHDYHADLTTSFGTFGAPPIPYAPHFSPDVMRAHYFAAPVRTTASGQLYFTTLVDGTGYIYINSFAGSGWGGEIDAALSALGAIPALIIDIRSNGGGNEDVALEVASRFYDTKHVYRRARFKSGSGHGDFGGWSDFTASPGGPRFSAPVALLTNRFDGSAAEEFTLMMRILPAVITVGDPTLGLGSNPLGVSLSNGWTYRVPQSQQSTPDGFVYQSRGLPPAIAVAWTDGDVAAGRDPYVDAALVALKRPRAH